MRASARALPLLLAAACASSPETDRAPALPDRTDDPEFVAAREAARPEFEAQADALAAGVYEPFVHPDSVRAPAPRRRPVTPPPAVDPAGDPSTEELLESLPPAEPRVETPPARVETPPARVEPARPAPAMVWSVQMGAYTTVTAALSRRRGLEREFPDFEAWHAVGGDGLVRVYLGAFAERDAAERARERAVARGYRDAFVGRVER